MVSGCSAVPPADGYAAILDSSGSRASKLAGNGSAASDGHVGRGCSPKRFRAQSRVREIQPSPIALQNLTFTSPATDRRLSHFRRPSQSPPQYQCLLLSAKSDALSNCSPKAFVAASEITLLMQLRKLFFIS